MTELSSYMQQKETVTKLHGELVKLREELESLSSANKTLLENNAKLFENNKKLSSELKVYQDAADSLRHQNAKLEGEKQSCRMKCETIVREKDRALSEKEQYINGLHSTVWHLQNSFVCSTYRMEETENGGFRQVLEFKRK